MSSDPPENGITTADEFGAALETLLAAAARNDIDPRGSWVYETDGGYDSWEVMIHELE